MTHGTTTARRRGRHRVRPGRVAFAVGLLAVAVLLAGLLLAPGRAPVAVAAPVVPADTTAGWMVYDRTAKKTVAQSAAHRQFRSASVVKLLIALDYLQTKGPTATIPAADATLLTSMLRSSDDDAASKLWVRGGYEQVVTRMVKLIGLVDTQPPTDRRYWGYTALSAADVVTVYNHLLDRAPASFRDRIVGTLEKSTQCAADGFDQSFGLPRGVAGTKAVKQGWSGYGSGPAGGRCVEGTVADTPPDAQSAQAAEEAPQAAADSRPAALAAPTLDLSSRAMHTSGLVDARRRVMVVLTLSPKAKTFESSSATITRMSTALHDDALVAVPTTTPAPTTKPTTTTPTTTTPTTTTPRTTTPTTTPAPAADPVDAYAAQLGRSGSSPGPATSPGYAVPGGRARDYRDGTIYWSQATGAHLLRGAVLTRYRALGGPGSVGFPTTDDVATRDGRGRVADLARSGGAALVAEPGGRTVLVTGRTLTRYRALGESRSLLAYPVIDTTGTPDGAGRYTHFSGSGGSIYDNPRRQAAYAVYGTIRGRWSQLGWERSRLGYPTSDEYAVTGGRRSDFDGGSIVWTARTGATTVTYR